jgi:ABC-2 type transport system ATP-binding protein
VVFQEPVVDRSLSGRFNLDLHARLWGIPPREAAGRIGELADTLGLEGLLDRPAGSYSGGQRRRLEIARALVSRPHVLFLDEPSVGLDPRIRAELLDVISGLRDRDETTILVTTHYLDAAERLCDRIAIMHHGEIVALDTPAALRGRLGSEVVELRVQSGAHTAVELLRTRGLAQQDAFSIGSTITIPTHGRSATEAIAAITELDLPIAGISTRLPTLDDVYLQLTGGRPGESD